ncbi:hypothetical protein KKA24_00395 [Patescibacteria group bacterium]|nr:hypothetical protein [Patescibacteria group bacterium]
MSIKKKIISFLVACLILSLILVFLFVYPTLGTIKKNLSELINIKKEIIIINNKKGEISETGDSCVLKLSDLDRSQNVFANLDVPVGLIEFFEDGASKNNLSINISPISSKKIDDDLWDFVSFRLSLFGSYGNFMKFFEKMETSQFLIEIQDISIKKLTESEVKENEGTSLKDIRANINLRVFAK